MTEKRWKFVEEYLVDRDAVQAAIRAGYSPDSACRRGETLLADPEVRKELDRRLARAEAERTAAAGEVLAYLSAVMRGEVEEEVVSISKGGVERAQRRAQIRDRSRAAELLGKRYRLFEGTAEERKSTLERLDQLIEGITEAAKRPAE